MAKKSFRKVPDSIRRQIEKTYGKPFVVFAVRKIKQGDELPNLPGLDTSAGSKIVMQEILPDPTRGTWAARNIYGWEIIRKDWPMTTKTFSHESPNFGDWDLGSHEVSWDRDVYQREYFPAYGLTISVVEVDRDKTHVILGFELKRVFPKLPEDEREFLFALNVFQESVGDSAIKTTDQDFKSFVSSLEVNWEILPVGDREEALARIRKSLSPTSEEDRVIQERFDLLYSMRPKNLVTGTSGFARYVGAQFGDDLVVFDNVRYGNAAYIMFNDWERLSKLSRIELQGSGEKFERIVHNPGWETRVQAIVNEYRSS